MNSPLGYISLCYEVPVRHASFDDSGGKQDGVFICAGYVAPDAYWPKFNRHWDEALASFRIPYLHTTEFLYSIKVLDSEAPQKTDDEVYAALEPFIRVVIENLVWNQGYGIVGVTEANAWTPLKKEEKRVVRQPKLDAIESAMGLACRSFGSTLNAADPVAIQMDESGDITAIVGAYQTMKSFPPYRAGIGAICFADDEKLRSIQAADLLAHLVLRQWRKSKLDSLDPRLRRLICEDLSRTEKHIVHHDAKTLSILARVRIEKHAKVSEV